MISDDKNGHITLANQ